MTKLPDSVTSAIANALRIEYACGVRDGLKVAEKAMDWLYRLPDTKRQQETREWLQAEIDKARRSLNEQ